MLPVIRTTKLDCSPAENIQNFPPYMQPNSVNLRFRWICTKCRSELVAFELVRWFGGQDVRRTSVAWVIRTSAQTSESHTWLFSCQILPPLPFSWNALGNQSKLQMLIWSVPLFTQHTLLRQTKRSGSFIFRSELWSFRLVCMQIALWFSCKMLLWQRMGGLSRTEWSRVQEMYELPWPESWILAFH